MINELIIHLGDTKTGSTSIQQALVQGAFHGSAGSICYPTRTNHNGLVKTLTQKRFYKEREPRFSKLGKVFRDRDDDFGIISAEHFQFVDPRLLDQSIREYWPELIDRIRLVAYVRPHGEKLLSSYAERVKLGTEMRSLEAFHAASSEAGLLDYAPRFERWRDVFGDRFALRPFVRSCLYQQDVIRDFLRYVFGHEAFETAETISANTSLTVGQLSLLREMHVTLAASLGTARRGRVKDAQVALSRIMSEHVQETGLGRDSGKLAMPAAMVEPFRKRYARDAEALDTAFFDGFPMSDALETLSGKTVREEQPIDAQRYFSAETVNAVRAFSRVLASLLTENPELVLGAAGKAKARAWALADQGFAETR